jgi:hypothetical protein
MKIVYHLHYSLESSKAELDHVVSENGLLTSQGVDHLRPFGS